MDLKCAVRFTASFERNLEEIERFFLRTEAAPMFGVLLDELADTVIPNLENFPEMGRLFLERSVCSVEATSAMARLVVQLGSFGGDGELREYIMTDYLLLYARIDRAVYLLSIRHHRQLAFDVR